MGFDIMKVFSGQPAPTQQAPASAQQQQQQQPKAQEPAFQPPVNSDPNPAPQQQPAPSSQQTPLDKFTDLFKNDPDEKPNPDDPNAPIWNIDPAKLQEQAQQLNFASDEKVQELAQTALKGDSAALLELMNAVTRNAYVQSAQLSGMLSEKATKTGVDRLTKTLPGQIRNTQSKDALEGINPVFKHPAMAPLIEPIRQQYQRRNPEASPQDVAKFVEGYLREMSASLGSNEPADPTGRRKADDASQDFENFFTPDQGW